LKNNLQKTAIVIGSGPNGMAAAVTLAKAGLSVTVYEKNSIPGGACRSQELVIKGVLNDVGSAVHPMVSVSPFFRSLPLSDYGLKWINSPAAIAHPLDDGTAVIVYKSIEETADNLDSVDKKAYIKLMTPLAQYFQTLIDEIMYFPKIPLRHPFLMLNFGRYAMLSAKGLAECNFKGERARAFIAGMGVHSIMNLKKASSSASGLMLAVAAHINGWPIPQGGAQSITDAMTTYFKSLGGNIVCDSEITSLEQLPVHDVLLADITPFQFLKMSSSQLPETYKNKIENYKYGPGVFKMDWIVSKPIPWKASDCLKAATVHLGGPLEDIVAAENDVHNGIVPEKPFVFLAQPSLFDSTRADNNQHVVWGYCHVPHNATFDMMERIESQVERFAPGFKASIIARHIMYPFDMESDNPNLIGGDISGGSQSFKKLIMPSISYKTPVAGTYLCSSSTPPSAGVHGMCGYRAAMTALKNLDR
jgi:phytoene dehydrogenase-like protein